MGSVRIDLVVVTQVTVVVSLLGWGVLALLERVTPHARTIWTVLAVVVLVASYVPVFLVEATTLATLGAAIGIGTGVGLAKIVDATTPLPATIAPWSIVVGVLLGAGVGVSAGIYPASRAARLDPVDAMRHE